VFRLSAEPSATGGRRFYENPLAVKGVER